MIFATMNVTPFHVSKKTKRSFPIFAYWQIENVEYLIKSLNYVLQEKLC